MIAHNCKKIKRRRTRVVECKIGRGYIHIIEEICEYDISEYHERYTIDSLGMTSLMRV